MGWLSRVFRGDARAPRDVDAAVRSALLAVLERDWDEAERLLVAAVRMDSDALEPWLALARLLRTRGEIGRAIQIHQNLLLRLDPGSADGRSVLTALAADFRHGGFLRRAIASYEELLERDPRNAEALRALTRLRADAREFDRAIELARRLARVDGKQAVPSEAELRVRAAEAMQAEGRSQEARRAVKRALRKAPGSVAGWRLLGELEAERGRSRAALAAWTRVVELDRGAAPEVYPRLEATFAALDRPRDFEKLLRQLIEEQPDDPGARIALARHQAARGEVDAAVAELRGVIERTPEQFEARGVLGRLLLAERRDEEAASEYAQLIDALERVAPGPAVEAFE